MKSLVKLCYIAYFFRERILSIEAGIGGFHSPARSWIDRYPWTRPQSFENDLQLSLLEWRPAFGAAFQLGWSVVLFFAAMSAGESATHLGYGLLFGVTALIFVLVIALALHRISLNAKSSEANREAAAKLSEFTRKTTHLEMHREPGEQLASLIQSFFELEAVAIFDADLHKVYQAGEWFAEQEDEVRNIYFFEKANHDADTGLTQRVLRMGNLPVGALLLRGEISGQISDIIACIIAITFDRYHSFANVSRTESARQAEQLRTTVLDSLAHAYKTPLTAIRAASTGLGEMGSLTPAQADMVALIDEQSGILNELTSRLLQTARLEAHNLTLRRETVAISPLIDDVLASFREQLENFSVKVSVVREDLSLCCDRDLLVALLTQYIDNAGKYATAGTIITIEAAEHTKEVVFSVHSVGPVIPAAECERIFDRYFRCADSANQVPGTGIGLSVGKRAAQAHGGDVWVSSDRDRGTTFFASLPLPPHGRYVHE
ncbi:MAG: ATP-binding protein, partial [Silvibacterium sp.]